VRGSPRGSDEGSLVIAFGLAYLVRQRNAPVFDRIRVEPGVCEGRPTIRGPRITVDFGLKLLGDGYTAVDIVRDSPELEEEDAYQAATYAAWLATERTSQLG
jgi:uncharacterized protein (DUF433 family)